MTLDKNKEKDQNNPDNSIFIFMLQNEIVEKNRQIVLAY